MTFYPNFQTWNIPVSNSTICDSDLINSFVPVGRDLLHDELRHLPGVAPGRADKTPEAAAVFQQHAAAFSQHLVKSRKISLST